VTYSAIARKFLLHLAKKIKTAERYKLFCKDGHYIGARIAKFLSEYQSRWMRTETRLLSVLIDNTPPLSLVINPLAGATLVLPSQLDQTVVHFRFLFFFDSVKAIRYFCT
jgi:hypothetical protein